ncbi:MAG: 50S ribosomal protein L30e [Thermoplasmata archaeon]
MDLVKEIKRATSTGKVSFGTEQAKKALRKGEAKILIIAKNIPDTSFLENIDKNVNIIKYDGSSSELGSICGKMFDISVLTIVDPGEAKFVKQQ